MRFIHNALASISNNVIDTLGAPAHLITSGNGSDHPHVNFELLLMDNAFADSDMIIFDDDTVKTFGELRGTLGIDRTYPAHIISKI